MNVSQASKKIGWTITVPIHRKTPFAPTNLPSQSLPKFEIISRIFSIWNFEWQRKLVVFTNFSRIGFLIIEI